MIKGIFIPLGTLLLTVVALPAPLAAQALPDIQEAINRNTSIDEDLRDQQRTTIGPEAAEEGEIDGEAGVYVLSMNEIFYIGASVGGGWEENPLRTVDDFGDSFFANAALTAGVQTQLGDTVGAGLAVTVSGIEYDQAFAPSSRNVTASANFGVPIRGTPIYLGLTTYGGFSYDGDFQNATGFYGASLNASGAIQLGQQTLLRGSVGGSRSLNEVKDNNAWSANLSVGITHQIAPRVTLSADARVSRIWFDDFFEDVTFIDRKDWQYGGNVSANWQMNDWLALNASAGYEKRDSAFFLSNYHGFAASIALTARKRF